MTQIKRKKSDYIIQSVDHALNVLEAFYGDESARTCTSCGHVHPGKG